MTVCLDPMTNPGVCGALITDSLSVTIRTALKYLLTVHPLIEQECMWTCRPALCPSTASLTHTHSHTYTHSTPHSLNPSTLDLGFILVAQCLCVILNDRERLSVNPLLMFTCTQTHQKFFILHLEVINLDQIHILF